MQPGKGSEITECRAYTKPQVADVLGVSERHIHRLIRAGRIKAVPIGRSVRISGTELLRVLRDGVRFGGRHGRR